ncbi:MAG TPA: hypothetical protein VGD54_10340 [Steroidobacteraceae bacterium]
MADRDLEARNLIRTRLAQSRAELIAILDPPRGDNGSGDPGNGHEFPRSRTMQMLMSGRGLGTMGAMIGGLLIARPALALRLLRMVPAGTVAKLLMGKAVSMLRSKTENRP